MTITEKNDYRDVSIIIPTYNEESTIADVITRIKKLNKEWEIIVVDDGSTDRSHEISTSLGIKILRNPYNIGLGGSLKRGARHANGNILVFLDGDGQHPPEEIPKLLEDIDNYNMTVGVRDFSQQFYHRGIGNWVLKYVAEMITGFKIPDLTTGFRCVHKNNFMDFIHLLPNGFSSATTLTIAMLEAGLFVKFIPITKISPRQHGNSKIRFFRDGFFFLKTAIRIIMMFSPLKVFFPVSFLIGAVGLIMSAFDIFVSNNLQESSVLMVILSAITFSFGVMADYLARLRRDISGKEKDRNFI